MFIYLMTPELIFFRPLNSHGLTVCDTVSLPLSRSHDRFFISHGFTKFGWIFSQKTHTFLKKQTQISHSNAAEELISSMINNNKTSSRSSLSLSWALLFILLLKTYTVKPSQWKSPLDLLKRAKKKILRPWGSFPYSRYSCQTVKQSTWIRCTKKVFSSYAGNSQEN